MIFKNFEPTDIVEGRTTKVASGFWPNGSTTWSASFFESNFWELSNAQTPSTAYGSSPYDVRKTLYYTEVYPDLVYKNTYKDSYFSIAYGHIGGSGSFDYETGSVKVSPTKAIYSQYKNLLLGNTDLDGRFTFKSGSSEISADDVFIVNFSSYKMKDKIDEGVFQISFAPVGSTGTPLTLIDDSFYVGKVQSVYQLVTGSLINVNKIKPDYQGIGLMYPNEGIVVFNAHKLNEILQLDEGFEINFRTDYLNYINSNGVTIKEMPSASYTTASKSDGGATVFRSMYNFSNQYYPQLKSSGPQPAKWNTYLNADLGNQNNTQIFFWSLKHSQQQMIVRKSEYVPARHYFVRVKNRDYNYSNNPTYVYDGKEVKTNGEKPPAGTIRNEDFYTDPQTYITSVGLYNSDNELVAIAKLSRPAVKSFSNELLLKIRLDY